MPLTERGLSLLELLNHVSLFWTIRQSLEYRAKKIRKGRIVERPSNLFRAKEKEKREGVGYFGA